MRRRGRSSRSRWCRVAGDAAARTMGPAVQPAELQFAQRLASHEKGVRDRAVRKLRQYISAKTQRETGGFTQEELLKIWKGLFYCMWVQDEPLLQEELAVTMSQLVHAVNNSEAQHLLIRTFWQTMNREWTEIDRPRLDKCHRLIRLTVRQSFEVLKRNGWEDSRIQLLLDILTKEVLHPASQAPHGVKGHLIAVYLQELSKVGGGELLADQNLKLIDPFCKIAAKTKDHTLVQAIARGVFEAIVPRPLSALDASTEDASEEPACELPPATAAGKGPPWASAAAEDRGVGGSEAPGPLLQFDYKAVAARLLEMTSRKNTPPFNRKHLCRLAEKFQHLSEGGVGPVSPAEDGPVNGDEPALRGRQQTDRGEERPGTGSGDAGGSASPASEEEPSKGPQRRKRKRRRRKSVQPEQPAAGSGVLASAPPEVGAREPPAGREVPLWNGAEQPSTAPAGARKRHLGELPPGHVKRRRLRKKGPRAVEEQSEGTLQGQASQGPKRKLKLSILPASDTCTAPQPCPAGSDAQRPPPQEASDAHRPSPQGVSDAHRPSPQGVSDTHRPSPQGVSDAHRPSPQGVSDAHRPSPQGVSDAHRPSPQGVSDAHRPSPQGVNNAHRPSPQGISDAQRPSPQGVSDAYRPPLQGASDAHRPSPQGVSDAHRPSPQGVSDAHRPSPQVSNTQKPSPQGDSSVQRPPPQGGKMKRKKGGPGALSLHGLSCPRPTSLAKRKRVTVTASSWPHAASPKQQDPVLSLGANGVLSPPRKKQLRTEKAFVQVSSPYPPKPLFCRKARSSAASCVPVQPSKTPSGTKKVTFGLSRNMTAEFKKTDKSILVSPTGPSRVAFDPTQRPLHGVLKSPASSSASTALTTRKLLLATPHRRPRAMDFF